MPSKTKKAPRIRRVYRKGGLIALICRGRVIFSHRDPAAIDSFLKGWAS